MPKVFCKLENAADEISGVKFTAMEESGRVSEEISAEKAELFASIPGYELVQDKPKKAAQPAKKEPAVAPVLDSAPAQDADESVF